VKASGRPIGRLRRESFPGIDYHGVVNQLRLIDYGKDLDLRDLSGSIKEPSLSYIPGARYKILVPKVDRDDNEIAGIRSPEIIVPIGTHTGWNHWAKGMAEKDLCFLVGTFSPFAKTKKERQASGDPRLSLEERYGDPAGYVAAVKAAADELVNQRLLLQEEADGYVARAQESSIVK
jgi:hypothetical protein